MITFIVPFTTRPSHTSRLYQRRGRCDVLQHGSLGKLFCVADRTVFSQDAEGTQGILSPTFPERASGEWFGYEAAFSARTGAPLNIADRFVPKEYRDWDVEIKGFDTVTSTQVTTAIYQKRTRALPSVGCEADAVTPDVVTCQYENVFGFRDGSFCAGPFHLSEPCEWSFTLVDPLDQQSRARIEFEHFGGGETGQSEYRNMKITVFLERREAKFCDGQVLPGCGGSGGFTAEQATDLDELNGSWDISSEAYAAKSSWRLLETNRTSTRVRDDLELLTATALPRGLSVAINPRDISLTVAVGWLRGNRRVVLQRVYNKEGALQSASRELETRHE